MLGVMEHEIFNSKFSNLSDVHDFWWLLYDGAITR